MRERKARRVSSIKTWKALDKRLWTQLEPYSRALIAYYRASRRAERGLNDQVSGIKAPGREAVFLHSVWFGHRQVTESMDALHEVPIYLKHLPKGLPPRITLYSWVRYHTENYFQEVYVFQNRVDVFFKQLCRAYRKHRSGPVLSARCKTLFQELKRHLEDLVTKRGEHVHQMRSDDQGLRTLGLVEHLVSIGGAPQRDRRGFFEDARFEKCFWMRTNNAWITKWLNSVSVALTPLLIAEDGTFRFPFLGP